MQSLTLDLMKLLYKMNKRSIAPTLSIGTTLVLLVIVDLHLTLLLYLVWDLEDTMMVLLLLWLIGEVVLGAIVLNVGTELSRLSALRQLIIGLLSHVMWSILCLRVLAASGSMHLLVLMGMYTEDCLRHDGIVGLDGAIYACVASHLLLLMMRRMPFDCERESELVVGLSMDMSGILLGLFGFIEYGYVLAGCTLLSCW